MSWQTALAGAGAVLLVAALYLGGLWLGLKFAEHNQRRGAK